MTQLSLILLGHKSQAGDLEQAKHPTVVATPISYNQPILDGK